MSMKISPLINIKMPTIVVNGAPVWNSESVQSTMEESMSEGKSSKVTITVDSRYLEFQWTH